MSKHDGVHSSGGADARARAQSCGNRGQMQTREHTPALTGDTEQPRRLSIELVNVIIRLADFRRRSPLYSSTVWTIYGPRKPQERIHRHSIPHATDINSVSGSGFFSGCFRTLAERNFGMVPFATESWTAGEFLGLPSALSRRSGDISKGCRVPFLGKSRQL